MALRSLPHRDAHLPEKPVGLPRTDRLRTNAENVRGLTATQPVTSHSSHLRIAASETGGPALSVFAVYYTAASLLRKDSASEGECTAPGGPRIDHFAQAITSNRFAAQRGHGQ